MAEPDPTQVAPWYLRNITQALALNETTGNVYVRTDADISIANANVTVGNVGITSFGNVPISGLTSSRDAVELSEDIKKRLQLWRYANGTPSTLTLAVSYTGTNTDLLYKLGWKN